MYDWNDLRFLLELARTGSTLAASRRLGVNQSTVQRRLAALEAALEERLVERQVGGYRLTDLGQAVLEKAVAVEFAANAFAQAVTESGRSGRGVIRLTCPEPVALRMAKAGILERFQAAHPGLSVEFVLSDHYVDLTKGEADVALRSGDTDDAVLVGRKIAESLWAVYAARSYVARHGAPAAETELELHPLIGFEETMVAHRASIWMQKVAPKAHYAARSRSVLGLISAAKAGVGVAPLPMSLGDAEPDLIRLFGPVPEMTRDWRMLAHPNQRHSRRIEAFFAFILSEKDALRPILTG